MLRLADRILVIPIPACLFRGITFLGARCTIIAPNTGIAAHAHRFSALYFTKHVRFLQTAAGLAQLPAHAAVFVRPRAVHGWRGVAGHRVHDAIVAHFHRGHSAHAIVSA